MRDVDREPSAAVDVSTDSVSSGNELRGSVLDVVRALLAGNDRDAVLEIVSKLVAENAKLSQRLARSGLSVQDERETQQGTAGDVSRRA